MKNFIQPGDTLTVVAVAAVTSGAGVLVGKLFGVACNAAQADAEVELKTTGVFRLPALNTATAGVGDIAYWDDTAKQVKAASAAGLAEVGVFASAKTNGPTDAIVRLNGTAVRIAS